MGYTRNEDGELEIVPEEAEVVRLIFRLYLEGMSVAGIKLHCNLFRLQFPDGIQQVSCVPRKAADGFCQHEVYLSSLAVPQEGTHQYAGEYRRNARYNTRQPGAGGKPEPEREHPLGYRKAV